MEDLPTLELCTIFSEGRNHLPCLMEVQSLNNIEGHVYLFFGVKVMAIKEFDTIDYTGSYNIFKDLYNQLNTLFYRLQILVQNLWHSHILPFEL